MRWEYEEQVAELHERLDGMGLSLDPLARAVLLRQISATYAAGGAPLSALSVTLQALQCLNGGCAEHLPLLSVLSLDLADRFFGVGHIDESLRLYAQAVEKLVMTYGAESDAVWIARERLGVAALRKGDVERARREFDAVLEVRRRHAGGDFLTEVRLISILLEQSRLARKVGELDSAESFLTEATQHADDPDTFGDEIFADILEERGSVSMERGKAEEAIKSLGMANSIRVSCFGAGHPKTLASLKKLGEAHEFAGQSDAAQSAFKIYQWHLGNGNSVGLLLSSPSSDLATQSVQGETKSRFADLEMSEYEAMHRLTESMNVRVQVIFALQDGNVPKAVRFARACVAEAIGGWEATLRYGSETQRQWWHMLADVVSTCAAVAHHDPIPLLLAALRLKGAVADSMAKDRPRFKISGLGMRLESARAMLRRIELDSSSEGAVLESARHIVERIESEITKESVGATDGTISPTPEELRAGIGPDRVLVEFVQYTIQGTDNIFGWRFGALIISASIPVAWVDIGLVEGAGGIDAQIGTLTELLRTRLLPSDQEFVAAASAVYNSIWAPIAKLVGSKPSEVIIAPDGCINLVSFAALWTGTSFLGETQRFRYVTSGRRLVGELPAQTPSRRGVIVVAPDFDHAHQDAGPIDVLRRFGERTLEQIGLRGGGEIPHAYSPLPGAHAEGERLRTVWGQNGLSDIVFLRGREATKLKVAEIERPWFLHFATHGQYVTGSKLPTNPMLRSWLALAGANRTLDLLRAGELPDDLNDGLLRADEIRLLDLAGTHLVALSACDSGTGAIRVGEGVFGLRRAFHEAGVRHLLLTLWPISDHKTAELMPEFYRLTLSSGDPVGALHEVQAKALESSRHANGPALAARLYGGFVMSS